MDEAVIETEAGRPARTSNVPLASIGLALGVLLSVLDQTVVAIALQSIATDLGGLESISWVVTAYVLASTATGTLYGRLSDRFGRRPVYLFSIMLFTVASLLCASAGTLGELIAYRALQGVGAGALFVVPTIALAELHPPEKRGKVQGYVGVLFAVASIGGPLVGGVLTDAVGWRWIFYVNLPIGVVAALLVAFTLRLPLLRQDAAVDFLGSTLLVGAVVSLMLVTEWGGRTYAWGSGVVLSLAAAFVVLLAGFVAWERRAANPVLALRLFTNRTLAVALPAAALLGALLYGVVVFLPTYMQNAFGMSATQSGFALIPYMLAFVLASGIAGAKVASVGAKPLLVLGPIIITAGVALLSMLDHNSSYPLFVVVCVVMGLGFGLIMQLLVTVSQNAVEPSDLAGATTAALSIRGLGMTLGVAVLGNMLSRRLEGSQVTADLVADTIPDVLMWSLPAAVVLVVLALAVPKPKPS
ncbi:MDR family MFS transporter [Pseudonocardia sp. TRM90224]|uniref:MDR family MFS transporter n=1 Tax=Pseudonocardia sp. TRM90224 TaxID=2812678 RepID=UPI001E29AFED|nr:MDR family MFS transporter [Pseudonocardia sp. TRM90224]